MFLWDDYGQLEFIRRDKSYFRCEVSNANFEKCLSRISLMYFFNKEGFYIKHPTQVQLLDVDLKIVDNYNYHMSLRLIQDSSQLVSHLDEEEDNVDVYREDPTQILEYKGIEDDVTENLSRLCHDDENHIYNF
jgi:hypothetical protein